MRIKFERLSPTQDWVYVTFNHKDWIHIGYMATTPDSPFNTIPPFDQFTEEDKQDIANLIWEEKGQRKLNEFKPPKNWYSADHPYSTAVDSILPFVSGGKSSESKSTESEQ